MTPIINTDLRFGLLLAGCVALPVAAAILLDSNLYNGWRQLYFLYGPVCLLAAIGLSRLASLAGRAGGPGAYCARRRSGASRSASRLK